MARSARGVQLPCDGLERGNHLRAQTLDDLALSFLPGRIAPCEQRHSLFGHRNLMAAPIVVTGLQTKPAPGAHARDIAAQRRLVHRKRSRQFRRPRVLAVRNRVQQAELAYLQSDPGESVVVHP